MRMPVGAFRAKAACFFGKIPGAVFTLTR